MPDNIDPRISPTLDPEVYVAIEGYNETTAQFVGGVVNAVSYAFQTLQQVHTARALADGNGAWNEDQKKLHVGKMAATRKESVLRKFDLAGRDLAANIAHAEKQLMEPLTERAGLGSLNGEVRAYVRGLKRGEREAFMNAALETDDEPTLEAVLGGQHFLSGLTTIDRDHYLRLYHTKKRPDLVRRLDVMRRFQDRLDKIGPVLHAQFEKAVGASPGVVAHLDRANEQALAALSAKPTI